MKLERRFVASFTKAAAVVAGATLAVTGCSSQGESPSDGGGQTTGGSNWLDDYAGDTFTVVAFNAAGGGDAIAAEAFGDYIEDATEGKVTLDYYFAGSLVPSVEHATAIRDGRADFGPIAPTFTPAEFPLSDAMTDFGSMPSPAFPNGMLQSYFVGADSLLNDELVRAEWEDQGLIPIMGGVPTPRFSIACATPFETPADLEGLRIRAASGTWAEVGDAFGMTPVTVASAEEYEGLQRGVIDCTNASDTTLVTSSLWEVAPYVVPQISTSNTSHAWAFNGDRFNALPTELQQIVREAGAEIFKAEVALRVGQIEELATTGRDEHGVTYVEPTAFEKKLEPLYKEQLSRIESELPATVADKRGWVDTMLERYDTARTILVDEIGFEEPDRTSIDATWDSITHVDHSKIDAFTERAMTELGIN